MYMCRTLRHFALASTLNTDIASFDAVTIAFTSEENPSNTEDDALSLYTQVNKENSK